jgi:ubiquinone/menaquinone biosynthesis C-methylase UbiE
VDTTIWTNSTERFSKRSEGYLRYRAGYSTVLLDFLKMECGLTPQCVVADVGSGTGLLAELFLQNGNRVYGIEPNREMREAAEHVLGSYPGFHSLATRAESTSLASGSVEFVTVGRALHWFDYRKALSEFSRIVKLQGWVVVVWLKRKTSTPLLAEYEELLLTYASEHRGKKRIQCEMEAQLSAEGFKNRILDCQWIFDFDHLKGHTFSLSVSPDIGHPNYAPLLDGLEALFEKYHVNERLAFDYETSIYYGQPEKLS